MKITIAYIPEEAGQVDAVLRLLRGFFPGAKLRSSISNPPFKHLYLTVKMPGKRCGVKENT